MYILILIRILHRIFLEFRGLSLDHGIFIFVGYRAEWNVLFDIFYKIFHGIFYWIP